MLGIYLVLISQLVAAETSHTPTTRSIIVTDDTQQVISEQAFDTWRASRINPDGPVKPEQILRLPSIHFGDTRVGYANENNWVRFRIHNASKNRSEWTIAVLPTAIPKVVLYQYDAISQALLSVQSVDPHKNQESRSFPHFDVKIPPGQDAVFVANVGKLMDFSFLVMSPEAARAHEHARTILNAVYVGAIIALLLSNLVFVFYSIDLTILLHLLSGVAIFVTLGIVNGIWLTGDWITPWLMIANLLAIIFTVRFLELRKYSRMAWRIYVAIAAGSVFVIIGMKTPLCTCVTPGVDYAGDFFLIAQVLLTVYYAIVLVQKAFKPARFILSGWLLLAFAALLYFLALYGVLRISIYTREFIPQVAHFLQLLIMSVAIAERMRSAELGRQAAEFRAQAADQLRMLIRVVCHDIANPLASVIGYSEMQLMETPNSKFIPRIIRNSLISAIIRQVRSMMAKQSGDGSMIKESLDVAAVLGEVVMTFERAASEKSVRLTFSSQPGLSIEADRVLFETSVLGNLVSNAIKFTESGKEVRIEAYRKDGHIEVRVADEGIGIPKEMIPHIFSQTTNISRAGTAGECGTGFGMSLVKSFVGMLGGEISLQSLTKEDGADRTGTAVMLRFPEASFTPPQSD
jgi:signal transduction histidine kinase